MSAMPVWVWRLIAETFSSASPSTRPPCSVNSGSLTTPTEAGVRWSGSESLVAMVFEAGT